MKNLFILCYLLNLFAFKASAQTSIWSVDASKYVGKIVAFDELAYQVNCQPGSKTCLIMLADPDVEKSPTITVVIHKVSGNKHINWLRSLEGHTINVSGRLLYAKGKFIINGNDSHTIIRGEKEHIMNDPAPVNPKR